MREEGSTWEGGMFRAPSTLPLYLRLFDLPILLRDGEAFSRTLVGVGSCAGSTWFLLLKTSCV